jgi:hypothetical protein
MSNLEERVAELERRMALLETRNAESAASVEANSPECPTPVTSLISITVSNKRHDPANPDLDSFEDHIWFDCAYTLSRDAKPTRAVKGVLEFADLFGEVRFRIQTTLNDPLTPGEPLVRSGIGFSYNQFLDEHQWMLVTDLKDMRCSFVVSNVLYGDGTSQGLGSDPHNLLK